MNQPVSAGFIDFRAGAIHLTENSDDDAVGIPDQDVQIYQYQDCLSITYINY
ncbi:hypothetical protein ACT8ZS_30615 [Paenibacillus sp. M.A.Huq-84]